MHSRTRSPSPACRGRHPGHAARGPLQLSPPFGPGGLRSPASPARPSAQRSPPAPPGLGTQPGLATHDHLRLHDSPGGLTGLRRAVLMAPSHSRERRQQRPWRKPGVGSRHQAAWSALSSQRRAAEPPRVSTPTALPGEPSALYTGSGREAAALHKPRCLRDSLRTVTIPIRENRKPPSPGSRRPAQGHPAGSVASGCDAGVPPVTGTLLRAPTAPL